MMNNYQRSGKWTREEEQYAIEIVNAFHNGTLDIPADSEISLRKYLAKKLMCSPKRVSKKYESSGYKGKQMYVRNTSVTKEDIKATSEKLRVLESRFLSSVAAMKAEEAAKRVDASFPPSRTESALTAVSPQGRKIDDPTPQPAPAGPLGSPYSSHLDAMTLAAASRSLVQVQQQNQASAVAAATGLSSSATWPQGSLAGLQLSSQSPSYNAAAGLRQSILMDSLSSIPPSLPSLGRALALGTNTTTAQGAAAPPSTASFPLRQAPSGGLITTNPLFSTSPVAIGGGTRGNPILRQQALAVLGTPSLGRGRMQMLQESLRIRNAPVVQPSLNSSPSQEQIASASLPQLTRRDESSLQHRHQMFMLGTADDSMLRGQLPRAGRKRSHDQEDEEEDAKQPAKRGKKPNS